MRIKRARKKTDEDLAMEKVMAELERRAKEEAPPAAVVKAEPVDATYLPNALVRLNITQQELDEYPLLTGSFDAIGGEDGAIDYLRRSDDPKARAVVRFYDLYSSDTMRRVIPFEAYCAAAKLPKKKFLQILMGEVCEQSDTTSTLLAAVAHPQIVEKTIKVAKSDDFGANEARAMLHKHRGFLPSPKNQQVTIMGNVNQDNRTDNSQNVNIPIAELEKVTSSIGKATDRFNQARIVRSESTMNEDAEEAEYTD